MNSKLAVIAGPLRGTSIALADDVTSIGRGSDNQLCIQEKSVSRRHCQIKRDDGRSKICDLESRCGTFVNGVPVGERFLEHGDQIRIGTSVFLFLLHEGDALPTLAPVADEDRADVTGSTVELPLEKALYLKQGRAALVHVKPERMVDDLMALVRISTAINSIHNPQALQHQLLESIFGVIPAERGAIVLANGTEEEFASIFGSDRSGRMDIPIPVSRTVVQRVLRAQVAILTNEISAREDFVKAPSLMASRVRSVLAVPLVAFEKRLGAIYLDSSEPQVRFDEGHLQLLTAVAAIAAVALENTHLLEWLREENQRLLGDIGVEHSMVGESQSMRKVHQFIVKVAPADSTVLITGESGTGKELVARAIHQSGPRTGKPFVAINCAALPEALLESELFGHERGAFTGAFTQKKGRLEVADGGTVLLDEIAELAPFLQAKLLRVLQEHEFERVGGTRSIKLDVRMIAATNRDLKEAIRSRTFREDLYHRLNVVSLAVPPLRERREDILLLANFFAAKHSAKCNRQVRGISDAAADCLMSYHWPGNIRELENAIERAVVLGSADVIRPEDLPEPLFESEPRSESQATRYHAIILEAKRQAIVRAVREAGGSYVEAAKLLGVHRNYLHRLIRNMHLKAILES